MEHLNSILFHKSGPANKQHTYQSINSQSEYRTNILIISMYFVPFITYFQYCMYAALKSGIARWHMAGKQENLSKINQSIFNISLIK